MEESDEDDQNEEIGVQDGSNANQPNDDGTEAGANDAGVEGGKKKKNWKKTLEEKKAQEEKKTYAPPQPRQKTARGDYVVTSFVIPDRSLGQDKKVS
jgi:hypothetical protein